MVICSLMVFSLSIMGQNRSGFLNSKFYYYDNNGKQEVPDLEAFGVLEEFGFYEDTANPGEYIKNRRVEYSYNDDKKFDQITTWQIKEAYSPVSNELVKSSCDKYLYENKQLKKIRRFEYTNGTEENEVEIEEYVYDDKDRIKTMKYSYKDTTGEFIEYSHQENEYEGENLKKKTQIFKEGDTEYKILKEFSYENNKLSELVYSEDEGDGKMIVRAKMKYSFNDDKTNKEIKLFRVSEDGTIGDEPVVTYTYEYNGGKIKSSSEIIMQGSTETKRKTEYSYSTHIKKSTKLNDIKGISYTLSLGQNSHIIGLHLTDNAQIGYAVYSLLGKQIACQPVRHYKAGSQSFIIDKIASVGILRLDINNSITFIKLVR